MNESEESGPAPGGGRLPWLLGTAAAVAGVVVVLVVARLGGDGRGPLGSLSRPPAGSLEPATVAARRLESFSYETATRNGQSWKITATSLTVSGEGLILVRPILELRQGGTLLARTTAEEGMLHRRRLVMSFSGAVTVSVGADLQIEADHLEMSPDGTISASGEVRMQTPHGLSSGQGVLVEPGLGRITLAPGSAQQEVMRWGGWGRTLMDMGDAYYQWARRAVAEESVTRAAER